jgi:uncharacterized protein YcbK (DUF882 family)
MRGLTPAEWQRVRYFRPQDFREEWQGRTSIWADWIAAPLVKGLDLLRGRTGVPLLVTSSGRSPEHQAALHRAGTSGTVRSYHEPSPSDGTVQAVDVAVGDRTGAVVYRVLQEAERMGLFEGVGVYEWGGLHLDIGDGWAARRPARWTWTKLGGYGAGDPYTIRWTLKLAAPPGPWVPREGGGAVVLGILAAVGISLAVLAGR